MSGISILTRGFVSQTDLPPFIFMRRVLPINLKIKKKRKINIKLRRV